MVAMPARAHVTVRCPVCEQPFRLACRIRDRHTNSGIEVRVGRPDTSAITAHIAKAHSVASASSANDT